MKSAAALSRAGTVWGNLTPEVRSGILMLAATGTLAGIHTVIRCILLRLPSSAVSSGFWF